MAERARELDELVELLRSARPPAQALAAAREGTLAASAPSGLGTAGLHLAWRAGLVVAGLFVASASPAIAPAERAAAVAQPRSIAADAAAVADPAPHEAHRVEPVAELVRAEVSDVREESAESAEAAEIAAVAEVAQDSALAERSRGPRARVRSSREEPAGKQRGEPAIGAPPPVLPAPPETGPPSAEHANALRAYASERYAEAAAGFAAVLEGGTDDAPARVAQAELFLAKCLYHLGLYHASAAAFDEVTRRGTEHPYFEASLRWLAMLAERLPEPSDVITAVGRYDAAQLGQLDTPETREHYAHLTYLLGRARYAEGRLEEAVRLLRRVPERSRHGLEARFFEGVSHVRQRRARPALAAFRRVVDAVGAGRTGGHPEPHRMRDLAWLSIARLYYALAMQQPDARDAHASELLSHAVAAWRHVPLSSEHWLESFFEETWALYVARHYARALGHVHALDSPWFRDAAHPEAQVIRAMIFVEHCQWDAVEHSVTRFHERYDPLHRDVQSAARMAATNEDAFRMLVAVRRGRSRVPPAAVPAVRAAFADRELVRHLAQVRSLHAEQRRLDALHTRASLETLAASASVDRLRQRVSAELAVLRALAEERAGALARRRLERLVEELDERMTQMDTVELELATHRREELRLARPPRMGPREGGRIVAVQGDQLWPFDTEWWRDELPFYLQEVDDRCSR